MEITPEHIETLRLAQIKNENTDRIDRAKRMKNYHPLYTIFASTAAAIIELLLLYPFEFMKTYSQFSPGISKWSVYNKPMKAAVGYMKERGVLGFYVGSQPMMVAAFFKAFVRMSAYDLTAKQSDPTAKRKWFPMYGLIAGGLECLVSLPFENIKNHMAHTSYMRVLEPGHQTFVKIVEKQGIKAFFRGFWPSFWSCAGQYSVRMSLFATLLPAFDNWASVRSRAIYDDMKAKSTMPEYREQFTRPDGSKYDIGEWQYQRPELGTIVIGTGSTLASIWLTMPFDNIKTKLQSPERPLYRGTMHCFSETIKHYGVKALWRGTTPRCVRATISTPVFITAYDMILEKMGSAGPHPTTSMGRIDF